MSAFQSSHPDESLFADAEMKVFSPNTKPLCSSQALEEVFETQEGHGVFGIASPSPRGIEGWGLYPPFSFNSPPPQSDLLRDTELSLVIDESHPLELNCIERDPFPDIERPSNEGEIDSMQLTGSINEPDISMENPNKHEFVPVKRMIQFPAITDAEMDGPSNAGKNIPFSVSPDCTNLNRMLLFSNEQISSASQINERQDSVLKRRPQLPYLKPMHIEPERPLEPKPIDRDINPKQPRGIASVHRRGKHGSSFTNRGKARVNREWSHLSEEELKKLRRVKNRESVEKCRTKQRLRMEALQMEQACLTTENKTLREMKELIKESCNEISAQVLKAGGHVHTLHTFFTRDAEAEGDD